MRRLSLAAVLLCCPAPAAAEPHPTDPGRVVGPTECGECHESEHAVWEGTAHARGWRELTRRDEARKISAALGIRRIKREPSCVSCHYLSAVVGGEVRPISGVACESCHGAAADWIDVHWDFGPSGATTETETAEHRASRVARSRAAGMRGPGRLHSIASSCYGCHVVMDENLVNFAGHPQPPALDLLATQGHLRHNFVRGRGENAPATAAHRRVVQVLGALLELEWSLRALATVTEPGPHGSVLRTRHARARSELEGLPDPASLPGVSDALAASAAAAGGGGGRLREAAERVAAAALRFASEADGAALPAIDEGSGRWPRVDAPAPAEADPETGSHAGR